jgi:hypothetical protein
MALPAAPAEAGGDKFLPLIYDLGGVNAAAVMRGIVPRTINAEVQAWLGVGSHPSGGAFVAGDAITVVGGTDGGSVVRRLMTDTAGRLLTRPELAYDAAGTLTFAYPRALKQAVLDGDNVAWMAVGTHVDAGAFGAGDPVAVIGGIDGSTVRKAIVDPSGFLRVDGRPVFAGNGHVNVAATGTAVPVKSSTAARLVRIKADPGNTQLIYVGISTVTANETAATGGYQLSAGQEVEVPLGPTGTGNLVNVFINGTINEGVSFLWWT